VHPCFTPDVLFTTAVYGIHKPGTAYRMDEVPIPLSVLLPSSYPSDGEILTAILNQVGISAGNAPPIGCHRAV
jgi:formylmethanofuran dehydrogenase subunit B